MQTCFLLLEQESLQGSHQIDTSDTPYLIVHLIKLLKALITPKEVGKLGTIEDFQKTVPLVPRNQANLQLLFEIEQNAQRACGVHGI